MAKLELIDDHEPKDNKSKIKSNKFFVFVDYLFLFVFLVFLCFILLKIAGLEFRSMDL